MIPARLSILRVLSEKPNSGVSTAPKMAVVTDTPVPRVSMRRDREYPLTNRFVLPYIPMAGQSIHAQTEEMFSM